MLSRRGFVGVLGAAAAAATLHPSFSRKGVAAEPIPGRKGPKFKLSLAAYSYRDQLQGKKDKPATMDLHGFIEECAAMELDGAELTGYYMPDPPTPEYLHDLHAHCFRLGLGVSGTAIRSDYGWPEGSEERAKELEHVRRWIDYAAELHAPCIRIFAGHVKKGVDAEKSHQLMVAGMKSSCAYAAQRGIYLALENHGGPTETAEGVLKFVKDVDSPWLGVNLDSGNFRGSVNPYDQMAMLAPYAVNAQIKVVLMMPDGTKQPTDYGRVIKILRDANYRGYVALEYEEPGDVAAECRKHVAAIREAMQKAS